VLYLDTSAFLKILVDEEHSRPLRRALSRTTAWSSTLLAVEAHRVALRLGIAAAEVDVRLAAVTLVVPSETSYVSARSVGTAELRTLDALHLAAAMELGTDLERFVTYDRRLAAGCDHHDIEVSSPGLPARWWTN
jgi:hypothetical protein